jgi:hypothetical protein
VKTTAKRRSLAVCVVAFLAFLVYGWWFTDRQPFSQSALIGLLVVVVALIVLAEVRRESRTASARDEATRRAPGYRVAIAFWTVAISALLAWELIALQSSPRSEHPTISSLVETAEHHHLARLALYAAWLWVGWELAS